MSSGFDSLGAETVGAFDYMSLLKGGAGMLSGAGGMFGGGGAGGGQPDAAAAEKARMQAEKDRAEASARTTKTILIVVGALFGVGLLAVVAGGARRAPVAALAPAAVK